ncbi:MAG: T9SS type A sorting domain-containing protein [Ignavibacteriae bacterium]|nr:T9SS C-terminal target domain-containing protein [Ignavibacteriota bacterium]NOG97637.1 T9SS type A sorting domain-containing protein [Ignavibacteriota bacterium]
MRKYFLTNIVLPVVWLLCLIVNISAQDSTLIFEEDFDNDVLSEWQIIDDVNDNSNWFLDESHLVQDSNIGQGSSQLGTNIIKKDLLLDNFTLRTKMYSTDDDYIGIVFRYVDSDNYYRFILSSQRKRIYLQKRVNGVTSLLDSFTDEEWHYVGFTTTITADNNNLKVYLNDELYLEAQDNSITGGSIGFMSCYNNGNFFDWIKIYSSFQIPEPDYNAASYRLPYIQNLTDSSVVILWGTNTASNSIVHIGLDTNSYQIIEESGANFNHQIDIENLEPYTKYYYRVYSDATASDWKYFRTPKLNPDEFTFLVYGDTQNNFLRHREIAGNFADHEFDFIAHCGDAVQRGIRNDWNVEFFDPLNDYLSEKPIYVAIGNHQLNSQNFYDYFETPNEEHENYYSFTYGNSFFIFFDNRSAAYPDVTYYPSIKEGSPQYTWLENQLSSTQAEEAEWIFAFSHVPSYHNFSLNVYPDNTQYLVPLFEQYGVDFSFSGHLHGYERGIRNNVNYVTAAGGGGIGPVKDDGFSDPPNPLTNYPFRRIYNFCKVEVKNSKVSFSAYDIFGDKIDSKIIDSTATGIKESLNNIKNNLKDSFGAYPNPYNSEVIFEYELTAPSNVSIKLFNVLGQQIDKLVNSYHKKGKHKVVLNTVGKSSGVFFAQLVTQNFNKTIKIIQSK